MDGIVCLFVVFGGGGQNSSLVCMVGITYVHIDMVTEFYG